MKERSSLIDILKGVAIIAVLLGHSIIVYPINIQEISFWGKPLTYFVGSFHMCLFFAISGYLCSYKGDYGKYIQKRTKRVLIPYLIFNVAALVARIVFSNFVNRDVSGVREMIIKLLFQGEGTSAGYWFLYAIFIVALVSPFLYKLVNVRYGKQVLVMIGVCCIILRCMFDITGYLSLEHVIYYLPYYIAGMMVRNAKTEYKHNVCITVCALVIYVAAFIYKLQYEPSGKVIDYILGFTGVYLVITIFSKIKLPKIVKHQLEMSGRYSLQYYLLNAFVMTGSRILIVTFFGITNPILIVSLMFVITYIISHIVSVYIIDSNNIFRFVCGLKIKHKESVTVGEQKDKRNHTGL